MTCALLTIGTELTRGDLNDTNSGWLADQLTSLGYEVTHMLSIDDNDERIVAALLALSRDHEVIVCTGGLGPTTDDRTTACVATALGVGTFRDLASLAIIHKLALNFGRVVSPSNEKQADFPEGATVLTNRKGTAPGFSVQIGACKAFFLPGVPREMSAMFREHVVPRLPNRGALFTTLRLRSFGLAEAEVNDRLAGLETEHNIIIGYRASHSEIEVKVQAEGRPDESQAELHQRASLAADQVALRLGSAVFSRGGARLPEVLGGLLVALKSTLGLAESCTGGLVSEWITQVPGASRYYRGGVVSYANAVKTQVLGVPDTILHKYGAVSEEVARSMAEGARRILNADYGLAITGVAGPDGGTKSKPVGLVHWAVAGPLHTVSKYATFHGDRVQIQNRAAMSALFSLYKMLMAPPAPPASTQDN
jgi:nicotinamide-nucleotide amidase